MTVEGAIDAIVLQEFRLRSAATTAQAARIVAGSAKGRRATVPLLTSIDDPRDVAIVTAMHAGDPPEDAGRTTLGPLVVSWEPLQRFTPRITERSSSIPSYYRLAVTGSGINNADPDPGAVTSDDPPDGGSAAPLDLLWIGIPVGTHAGLLVLTGSDEDERATRPDPRDWPLPLSTYLGVRIYAGR